MKKILKIEFERAFYGKGMLIAVAIGMILVIMQIINVVIPAASNILGNFSGSASSYPSSVFECWFGMDVLHPYRTIYITILPILATLSYGTSYFTDLKSGYIKNLLVRYSKKSILRAKYIAVFVVGGLTVIIPIVFTLLVSAALLPSLIPGNQGIFGITAAHMFTSLFYTHPYIYTLLYIVIYFLYGGAFATLALTVSRIFDYSFIVLIVPFAVYYILGIVGQLFKNGMFGNFRPQKLLSMYQIAGEKEFVFFGMWMIITIISYSIFMFRGNRSDII